MEFLIRKKMKVKKIRGNWQHDFITSQYLHCKLPPLYRGWSLNVAVWSQGNLIFSVQASHIHGILLTASLPIPKWGSTLILLWKLIPFFTSNRVPHPYESLLISSYVSSSCVRRWWSCLVNFPLFSLPSFFFESKAPFSRSDWPQLEPLLAGPLLS